MKRVIKKLIHIIGYAFIVFIMIMPAFAFQPIMFQGTSIGSADFNENIKVLSEVINIDADADFNTATYYAEYHIINTQDGLQVPVIFNTYGDVTYYEDKKISISIDGKPVEVQIIEPHLLEEAETSYSTENRVSQNNSQNDRDVVTANQEDINASGELSRLLNSTTFMSENGVKPFRSYQEYSQFIALNLDKGKHTIRTTYNVDPSYYGSDWTGINTFDYRFANFKPSAAYQGTRLFFNFEGNSDYISVDIDEEFDQPLEQTKLWTAKKQTPITMSFTYQKPLNAVAKVLTSVSPYVVILLALLMFGRTNYQLLKKTQQDTPEYTWSLMIFTGLLFPFLSIMVAYFYLLFTDLVIGQGATGEMRGLFFMWMLPLSYISATPLYFLVMLGLCIEIKKENKDSP